MYLYKTFNLIMQLISIFSKAIADLWRIYMESLDLTYRLIALKIDSKPESTLCFKYFRNIVIVVTKRKNKKMKITKIYLFLLPPLPSQGGGLVATLPPTPHPHPYQPSDFFYGKNF